MNCLLKIYYMLCIAVLLPALKLNAQKQSEIIKEFLDVNSILKSKPLEAKVMVRQVHIFKGQSRSDTSLMDMVSREHFSYLKTAVIEQYISDSSAVMVDRGNRRLIYYPEASAVVAQMHNSASWDLNGSNIKEILKNFNASRVSSNKDTITIKLASNKELQGTKIPSMELTLDFSPLGKKPYRVSMVKRNLLSDKAGEMTGTSVLINKEHFEVGETWTIIDYLELSSKPVRKAPYTAINEIVGLSNGSYIARGDFEGFDITVN